MAQVRLTSSLIQPGCLILFHRAEIYVFLVVYNSLTPKVMHEGFCHTRPILKFSLHHTVYKVCQTSQDVEMVEVNMDKRFECNQCEKSYYDIDSLSRHIRWKHTLPTRTFECTDCDSSFKLKSSLVRHQRKKHPENDD